MPKNSSIPANTPNARNLAAREIEDGSWDEDWPCLKARAELAEGKYAQALETIEEALRQHDSSVRLLLLARTSICFNGDERESERRCFRSWIDS